MLLKLKGLQVEIWTGDNKGASCGENRTEWTHHSTVSLRSLLKAVYRLATGASKREHL